MRQLVPSEEILVRGVVEIDQVPIGGLRLADDVEIDGIAPDREEVLVVAFLQRCGEPSHHPLAHHLLCIIDAGNPDGLHRPVEQCTSRRFHGHPALKRNGLECSTLARNGEHTSGLCALLRAPIDHEDRRCTQRHAGNGNCVQLFAEQEIRHQGRHGRHQVEQARDRSCRGVADQPVQ